MCVCDVQYTNHQSLVTICHCDMCQDMSWSTVCTVHVLFVTFCHIGSCHSDNAYCSLLTKGGNNLSIDKGSFNFASHCYSIPCVPSSVIPPPPTLPITRLFTAAGAILFTIGLLRFHGSCSLPLPLHLSFVRCISEVV